MNSATQTLDDVLNEARTKGAQLEQAFDVPVLLVVSDETELDGATAVTSPASAAKSGEERKGPVTYVVPLQPRYKEKHPSGADSKLSFGRSTVCDVVLPFSPISKHHGFFAHAGSVWSVEDVGSTNGTVVNGHKAGASGLLLTDGCSLQMGAVVARFLSAKAFCAVLRERLALG